MTDNVDDVGVFDRVGPLIHFAGESFEKFTPCGVKVNRRSPLFSFTWSTNVPNPVNCADCLKHRPKKRMIPTWENAGGKRRR